jgi:hypothetical protein
MTAMKRLTRAELNRRVAARDAARDAADAHRAMVEADRREEELALSEITMNREAS